MISSWPLDPAQSETALESRLKDIVDPAYPHPKVPTYLLFDDGQHSYGDHLFWNAFLKDIPSYSNYYAILFCSYGSPSSRPIEYPIGTPLVLRAIARVSLWPIAESVGLLLTRSEFNEVMERYEGKPNLHPDLLDLFFDLTGGHVGAVVDLLHIVTYEVIFSLRTYTSSTLLTIPPEGCRNAERGTVHP